MSHPRRNVPRFTIFTDDRKEYNALLTYQRIHRDRQEGVRRRRDPPLPPVVPPEKSMAYQRKLARYVFAEADPNDPDRIYHNAEFSVFVETHDASYGGVGPMITYMRRNGLLSGKRGRHKLNWAKRHILDGDE